MYITLLCTKACYPCGNTTFAVNMAFNICCPRDCVSRHNGGTAGAPLKPLRVDSALRALSTLMEIPMKRFTFTSRSFS